LDVAAISAPIGLFLGRLANFINQEHCGHLTDLPWGVVFPYWPDGPRHPSQLYEAGLEGMMLFCVLWVWMCRHRTKSEPGQLSGIFLMGYGIMRVISEFFRVPDGVFFGITLGQWYSFPGMILGLWLYFPSLQRKKSPI
jgi:phosphatidylglycerol:prolipoprotein diacylglycerol transferase